MTPSQILIEKTVNAPRERVFKAFLVPEDLIGWHHAGGGWTTPHAEVDPNVGGRFNIGFRSPDGAEGFDFTGTFTEISEPTRIAYIIDPEIAETKDGGRPVSIEFEDQGGKTLIKLTLALESLNSEELQRQGWTEMLVNLADYIDTVK